MGRRTMDVTAELITSAFRQGDEAHLRVVKDGLPDDAQVVDVLFSRHERFCGPPNTVRFVLKSELWEGESGSVNPMLTNLPCAPPVELDLTEHFRRRA